MQPFRRTALPQRCCQPSGQPSDHYSVSHRHGRLVLNPSIHQKWRAADVSHEPAKTAEPEGCRHSLGEQRRSSAANSQRPHPHPPRGRLSFGVRRNPVLGFACWPCRHSKPPFGCPSSACRHCGERQMAGCPYRRNQAAIGISLCCALHVQHERCGRLSDGVLSLTPSRGSRAQGPTILEKPSCMRAS